MAHVSRLLFQWWPLRRVRVRGPSMAPTLSDGDIVLVRMGAQTRPGSVVLVRWSFRPHQLSIKRAACQRESGWQVIGDNSAASTDSRDWGPAEVLGVAAWRLWPKPWRGRIRE